MIVKCACQNCGQNIEFEAEHGGSFVNCPVCARSTRLLIPGSTLAQSGQPSQPFSAPAKVRSPWPMIIVIPFAALIIILTICVLIKTYGASETAGAAGEIMGVSLLTILYGIATVLAFVLAAFWLIFPWMVYSKMTRVIEILEQIRDQKRG